MAQPKETIVFLLEIENDKTIKTMQEVIDQQKELKKVLLNATDTGSEAYEKLRLQFKENQKAITAFNQDLRNSAPLAQRIEEGVTASFKKVGSVIAGAFAFDAVLNFGRSLDELTDKIEDGFARVNTVAQLSGDELKNLQDRAVEIGKEGASELEKIPDALFSILSGTGDTELSMELLRQSVLATDAGFGELGATASAGVNILNAVGREAITSQEVFDVLFATQKEGVVTFDQLAKVLPNVIPAAKSVGFSFQETSAALATLTKQGLDAEQGGTALRAFFSSFTNKGKLEKLNKTLGTIGASVFDSEGKLRSLTDIVKDFDKVLTSASSDAERSSIVGGLGLDQNSVKALQGLVAGVGDLESVSKSINNASEGVGELQKQLALSENGTRTIGKATNAFKAELLELGQSVTPLADEAQILFYETMQKGVEILNNVIKFFKENEAAATVLKNTFATLVGFLSSKAFVALLGFGKNLKLVGTLISGLGTPISTVIGLLSKLNLVVRANPLGAIVTAIGVAATAFELFNEETAVATTQVEKFSANSAELEGTINNINLEMSKEISNANSLFEALKDTNLSQEQRSQIIAQINEQYKQYLPNLLSEESSLNDIEAAQKAVNAALTQSFTLKIQEATRADALTEKIKFQQKEFLKLQQLAKESGIDLSADLVQFQKVVENIDEKTQLGDSIRKFFGAFSFGAVDTGDKLLDEFLGNLASIRNSFINTKETLTDGRIINNVTKVDDFLTKTARTTDKYNEAINATSASIDQLTGSTAGLNEEITKTGISVEESSKKAKKAAKDREDEYNKLLGVIKETEDTTIKTAEKTFIERKRFFDELLDSYSLTEQQRLDLLERSSAEETKLKLTVRDATKKSLEEQLALAKDFKKDSENLTINNLTEQEKAETDYTNFVIGERQRLKKEKEGISQKEFEAGLIQLGSQAESAEREIKIFQKKFEERRKILEGAGVEEKQILAEQQQGISQITETFGIKAIDAAERIQNAMATMEFNAGERSVQAKEDFEKRKLAIALDRQQAELRLLEQLGSADEVRMAELKASISSLSAQMQDDFKQAGFSIQQFSDGFSDAAGKALEFGSKINELLNMATELALEGLDRQSEQAKMKLDGVQDQLNVIDERIATTNATNKAALLKERKEIQKRYDEEKKAAEKIEKEKEQLKKEAFERNKAFNIISAVMNGAVAITKSIADLGPIAGAIMAAVTAAITVAQVAIIASQQYKLGGLIEKYKLGGEIAKYANGGDVFPSATGGMIKGKSHAQGGVPFMIGGKRMAEAEGGEFISSVATTKMFYPQLVQMNEIGNRLGKSASIPNITRVPPITKFQDGGLLTAQAFITRDEFIAFTQKVMTDNNQINATLQETNKLLAANKKIVFSMSEFSNAQLKYSFSENNDDQ